MDKIPVGILGATGIVGQRYIRLLSNHPWFEITEVVASEKSAGKTYGEVMKYRWKMGGEIPYEVRDKVIKECVPKLDCKIVFSALDASVAGPIEEDFAREGYIVISNARNHRMDEDVPLLIPEVNPESLQLIEIQKKRRGFKGFIITHPNCSTTHLCLAIKPIHDKFKIRKIIVTTMQALSGAGYPGVASLDIVDNIIPYIPLEEEKIENETLKILGKVENGKIKYADILVSATCNRVPVSDGHLESVSIELENKPSMDELIECMDSFDPLKNYDLPSHVKPIIILKEEDRPQPRLDRNLANGMASVVGRIRKCNVLDYKFLILGNNTIRGGAGGAILIAELLKYMKMI
jgi:aspartate-semialdehyde dehydrogenase